MAQIIAPTIAMDIATSVNACLDPLCEECFRSTYQRLFDKFNLSDSQRDSFMDFFWQTLKTERNSSTPEIQRMLNQRLSLIVGIDDLFADEKATSNAMAKALYEDWKPQVSKSKNPFDMALRLAIAGNIMDYGANNNFDVMATITRVMYARFAIDFSKKLQESISNAKSVLYLGDNAGEIVFDKLFLETIGHPNVTYAVRGGFTLNDATTADAYEVGIDRVAQVISNGFNAPSTVLSSCSPEFMEAYNSADLIISKGQGNLEGLIYENNPRIFFLLMVKCDVMAKMLNVAKGSFVVYNPTKPN
ncbi:MAG: DUF89 family protein [Bacteroidales bacterium]|nr:DUF89 family protein [Bacteroidales bacterium]